MKNNPSPKPSHARRALPSLLLGGIALACSLSAQAFDLDDVKFDPQRLWLNIGTYNYHLQSDRNLRNANPGLGAEYRYDADWTLVAGRHLNAKDAYSNYVGAAYQPWQFAGARVGVMVGVFNGYPYESHGSWFVGAAPAASWEFGNVGLNLIYMPRYDDRAYESIGVQFKMRLP